MRTVVYFIYSFIAQFVIGLSLAHAAESASSKEKSISKELPAVYDSVGNMKRQLNASKVDGRKEFLSPSVAMGGPGMDGGGGGTVLTSDGQLRLLDLALAEQLPLRPFENSSYLDILAPMGFYVRNVARVVPNRSFFACGAELLRRQDNVLLNSIKPEGLDVIVVFTEVPLSQKESRLAQVVFESPNGHGYPYEATQLPKDALASPSLPISYQRPVASYAAQSVDSLGWFPRQTLLVNSQLYNKLSLQDRCALQVHEIFRYLSNSGKLEDLDISRLLTRPLGTQEIQNLTTKVSHLQTVRLDEIPATDLFKGLSISQQGSIANLMNLDADSIRLIEKLMISAGLVKSEVGSNGFADQMNILKNVELPQRVAPIEVIMAETKYEDLTPHGQARFRYQQEKLKGKVLDLRKLISE
ncbi:hypothetical protein DOM22_02635 [Bdellovibrio sp. ZAP7]|nr:hypothetical protein DOM22_02635 [Bdellovibrio sp. ZAP7]